MDADLIAERLIEGTSRFGINEESRAFNLLASFQLVELSLKIYIGTANEIIESRVSEIIPFNPDSRAIEKASLERLLAMFKVVNSNRALQKRLAELIEKRNDVAHRMLLPHFGVVRHGSDYRRVHEELKKAEESLSRAMKSLAKEIVSIKERRIIAKA